MSKAVLPLQYVIFYVVFCIAKMLISILNVSFSRLITSFEREREREREREISCYKSLVNLWALFGR